MRVEHFSQILRYFGPSWLTYRLLYAARSRSGLLRYKLPSGIWADYPLTDLLDDPLLATPTRYHEYRKDRSPSFLFSPEIFHQHRSLFTQWDTKELSPQYEVEGLVKGQWRYFSHMVAGSTFPPNWHSNPCTGESAPSNVHWSQIGDFGHGDIKVIWELSRFGVAYSLARAYARSGNNCYANYFWQLLEDWQLNNPPNQGANWKCGQETALRVMACCFALYAFLDSPSTTPERIVSLTQLIAVSGYRIEGNLSYALSQRNNHGISEGVGLWTIGLLFPELRHASRWRKQGQQVLERLAQELIYDDGSFVQHSVNYHRLMLHAYLWAIELGEKNKQPLSSTLKQRVGKAGHFLYQLQDQQSGHLPYYGQNDGALILPLTNADYQNFRPVIQATHYLSTGSRCYESGVWDEELLWLFGPHAIEAPLSPPPVTDLRAKVGGYYTLRSKDGFAFVRCGTYKDRPGQADMLHVDLWWRGQNIALDAGTYSYNAPLPWDNPLAGTAYHNTITVDDRDQMDRVGKFLWLPWLAGCETAYTHSPDRHVSYWEGEHNGYERLPHPVHYRRAILKVGEKGWLMWDRLVSNTAHKYRLHWLLLDCPMNWDDLECRLCLETSSGDYYVQLGSDSDSTHFFLIRGDPDNPRGWHAPYYQFRAPTLSVTGEDNQQSINFWTFFSAAPSIMRKEGNTFRLEGQDWLLTATTSLDSEAPILYNIELTHSTKEN